MKQDVDCSEAHSIYQFQVAYKQQLRWEQVGTYVDAGAANMQIRQTKTTARTKTFMMQICFFKLEDRNQNKLGMFSKSN